MAPIMSAFCFFWGPLSPGIPFLQVKNRWRSSELSFYTSFAFSHLERIISHFIVLRFRLGSYCTWYIASNMHRMGDFYIVLKHKFPSLCFRVKLCEQVSAPSPRSSSTQIGVSQSESYFWGIYGKKIRQAAAGMS